MNGIICVNKPQNFTSFDVVAIMRRVCRTKAIGHGGTLDPMATGVLPLFVGNATKAADILPDDTKQYKASFRLGITTDTQDISGKILSQCECDIPRETVEKALGNFRGDILQLPPMYSAVQVNGQRLYDLARQGKEVERTARKINVSHIELLSYSGNEGELLIDCSKGTYIRTLIHDMGQLTGAGAAMTELVRTRAGIFTLSDCYDLEKLRGMINDENGEKEVEKLLTPLDKLFGGYPKINLDEKQTVLYKNGVVLDAGRIAGISANDGFYSVYDDSGNFLAIAKIGNENELTVVKRFKQT